MKSSLRQSDKRSLQQLNRPSLQQSDKMLALIARRFKMLGEPYRLRLLQVLEQGEKTVGELVLALDGKQPNVSKHLHMLYDAGLVSRRREGTSIYYGIGDTMVIKLCELVCHNASERAKEEYDELRAPVPVRRA
jgi:DNA-binding transcriptional ArsR family regulator